MARMLHREENRVRWIGVRPAHEGEQVFESASQTGVGNKVIYTVPVGQTLFLCTATLGTLTPAAGHLNLGYYDSGGIFQKYLLAFHIETGEPVSPGVATYYPPLEIEAGASIRVVVSVAALIGIGSIFGWVE